jgi:5-(carboxyamino)imidazole ribonucleotide synthase
MTTVGVLGGGQLGRLLALAGYPLGLRFRFLDPAADAPAGDVASHICAPYDEANLMRFAARVDVITYEFENIPADAAASVARRVPVYPPPEALAVTQDRLKEKEFLQRLQIPTTEFAAVGTSWKSVVEALERVTLPAVMKRRHLGYDGGGQQVLWTLKQAEAAWGALGSRPVILERLVGFARELSLIAVRGRDSEVRCYPLVENRHVEGILDCSLAPAPGVTEALQAEAEQYVSRLFETLGYVGVLTVEFFERDGRLLVNELAPRVHNSGHWTIEGAACSQFENHLRAMLGLPLGSTAPVGCSAMINIIGTLPDPVPMLRLPDTHLHLYGKTPRPGRKLGHLTSRVADAGSLEGRVRLLQRFIHGDNSNGRRPSREK